MRHHPKEGDLIICETAASVWNYHLRRIGPEGPKLSGGAGHAICGYPVGWDTLIPLTTYGHKAEHIPESYCKEYGVLAGLPGYEEETT